MKICQILASHDYGGLEKHTIELSLELYKQNIDITVIAHESFQKYFKNIPFIPLDFSSSRYNPFMLYELYKILNKYEFDIVHAQANKASSMVAILKYFLSPNTKTIATIHSQKKNIKSFEKFDYVIGVSYRVLDSLNNASKTVIYNGINTPKVTYDELFWHKFGITKESFVICAIGRLEIVKNFSMLIKSICELPIELVIVGDGSQKDNLKKLAKELKISSKVHFLGFRKDVNDILYHSQLCIISSDREGFSYVMAEALLLEKPIISTDVGDMTRILPKGYVVPVDDVDAMQNSILKVLNNYEDSLNIFEKSFEFAKMNFTLEYMVKKVKDLYTSIINEECK